ncbi:MAG: nuclear transport factor 2 family protein [Ewingella sp.]|uniref:nuclear transport factor 2 family protein n=1 Tax=Ewingella TaxID=41201 RepID=UPI0017DE33BC|nr:nuclear transport factor 2 family protein [Pseudomonas reactans]
MTLKVTESESVQKTLAQLAEVYRQLDQSSLPQLAQIYHPQVIFIDPVGQHDGIAALEGYFRQLLKSVNDCRFDIQQTLVSGDEATLVWCMAYSHPSLKKGETLYLDGISHLKLAEDQVIYQRDYYDLGAMLYEHVPLLGRAIKALKARLKA